MSKINYRYQQGDVLRLCHGNPLIPAGEYVMLDVSDTVVMARLIHSARGHKISKKRVYVQITDVCLFQETGRTFRAASGANRTPAPAYAQSVTAYAGNAVAEA